VYIRLLSTYIFLEFPFLGLKFFFGFLESFGCGLVPLHLVLKPYDLQTSFTNSSLGIVSHTHEEMLICIPHKCSGIYTFPTWWK